MYRNDRLQQNVPTNLTCGIHGAPCKQRYYVKARKCVYQAVFVPIGPCVHGSQWPAKANDVPKGALKYWFLVSSLNVFLLKNYFISKKTSNISF